MDLFHQTSTRFNRRCWALITYPRMIIILVIGTVLYNEFLCYWMATFWWSSIYSSNPDHLRLLFVADPQLVGFNDMAVARPISRADCDRYVAKTFSYALSHTQPDVIVYMGDLLDEGSTANDEDYGTYADRFNQVFQTHRDIQRIVIPGDNDVGGEGFDEKTAKKIERFNRYFVPSGEGKTGTNAIVKSKFVDFLTLNLDERDYAIDENYISELNQIRLPDTGQYNVILNHFEMVDRFEVGPLVKAFKTNVIFTAHRHKAAIYTCLDCREPRIEEPGRWKRQWRGGRMEIKDSEIHTFDIKESKSITEIAIPTCSYRMGVPQMGYGSAVIDSDGQLHFTVLWLPSRYKHLAGYIFVLVAIVFSMFLKCLSLILCRHKGSNYRPAVLPLYAR